MKKFIIVLLSLAAFYISASYAESVNVCASNDSISTDLPQFRLQNNRVAITNYEWNSLPIHGKCTTLKLIKNRASLVGKKIDVLFTTQPGVLNQNIGNVTFNSLAEFDDCQVSIQYISYSRLSVKARASKVCTNIPRNIPFVKIPLNP
ncbi:MAG: hypothetical protein KAH18_08090 [Psychromonas sp.]|nr:hypothetical protein [Psychromonas sp.]